MFEIFGDYRLLAPSVMYVIGFILMMVVSLTTCKKHDVTKKEAFFFTLVSYYGGVAGAMFMGDQFSRISVKYGGLESNVAIFGAVMFVPFYIIGAALLAGKPWRKVMDLMAPGGFIILTCAKFGCSIYGCCPGLEWEHGLYTPVYDKVMFPSQIFESITMCFVIAFCFWYGLKYKKRVPGKAYPFTIIFYSITRFGWEFVRYYDVPEMRHMFLGLTYWQLWCIVTLVGGCVWLAIMNLPSLPEREERFYIKRAEVAEKIKAKLPVGKKSDEPVQESEAE